MAAALRDEWQVFLLAVQFLTRLPVPGDLPFSDDRMVRAAGYYPAVGALVGVIVAAVFWVGFSLTTPGVAAFAALAAGLLATGAFHEDGLADAADGLVGGQDRSAVLRIMRDSRIGSYGALALIAVLGLKATTLAGLGAAAPVALIAGHTISRLAPVLVIANMDYAREEGSKFTAPVVDQRGLWIAGCTAAVLAIGLAVWLGPGAMVTGLGVAGICGWLFVRLCQRRIQGYTGDCLGAVQQICEAGLYLGVLAWL